MLCYDEFHVHVRDDVVDLIIARRSAYVRIANQFLFVRCYYRFVILGQRPLNTHNTLT